MADFVALAALGYGPDLVPIAPPDAQISTYAWVADEKERARRIKQITETRGKVPARRLHDGTWAGFAGFTKISATAADHATWTAWGAGAGLQGARFPALDIDVEDEDFVRALLTRVEAITGYIFGRVGRHPRILLPFRAAPDYEPRKHRLPLPSFGENAAVEWLGAGQQYLIEGTHPKTGQPYSWGRRGFPEADRLPVVTAEQVDRIFAAAAELGGVNPGNTPATTRLSTEVQAPVLAPNIQALADAVAAIPNDLVYDTWINLGIAIKSASECAGEGLDIWIEWSLAHPETTPEMCFYKWDSFHPPFKAGWDTIRALAPGAAAQLATYDFTAQEAPATPIDAMLDRYIWVERVKLAYDRNEGSLLDDLQFSVRNNHIAHPRGKANAWALWLGDVDRLQRAASVTYRPGADMLVREKEGMCVNTWQRPDWTPRVVTDDDARPWLEHVEYLVPDADERTALLDWFAFIIQHQDKKPNWQVVWGSEQHGVGKDMALEPIRLALGAKNVRNVQPEQILSDYTDWFENARLVVVEDMQSYGKRAIESRLRPLMAAPPDYVSINKKYMATYDVPNLTALCFLTNEMTAVPISKEDRRYFVTWSHAEPRDEDYYAGFAAWYANGGCDAAASWLMARDISAFNAKGRAPMTDAKRHMIGATMSPLECWIHDGIADGAGAFKPDIVDVGDLLKRVPKEFRWDSGTPRRLAQMLEKAGATPLGRVRLGKTLHTTEEDKGNLYVLRRHSMYRDVPVTKVVDMFWAQRETAENEALKGEFTNASSHGTTALF